MFSCAEHFPFRSLTLNSTCTVQQCFYIGSEEVAMEVADKMGATDLTDAWIFADQAWFIGSAAFTF